MQMGTLQNTPDRNIICSHGEGNDLKFAVGSMIGWHVMMEDRNVTKAKLEGRENLSYFAVFDGHGGPTCSNYCANHLLDCVLNVEGFDANMPTAIERGFLQFDDYLRKLDDLKETSGTTALCVFISEDKYFVANCGDSRAVLWRNNARVFATQDHKPNLISEKLRINAAGGIVQNGRISWGHRSLGVSRALGDFELKKQSDKDQLHQILSSQPDVYVQQKDDNDEFMILASDGVWDVITDEALCQYVHDTLLITDDLEEVVKLAIDTCFYKGATDNITLILITFKNCPKPTATAKAADEALNKNIEIIFTGIIQEFPNIDYYGILQQLYLVKKIPGLPRGGGIQSKRRFIDQLYRKYFPGFSSNQVVHTNIR